MAYPMVPWPTFSEFRERLVSEFGCRYVHVPDGQMFVNGNPVGELERKVDGKVRRYAVCYDDDYRIAPSVVRSICTQLHVDPDAFGMNLG